ncbi:NAD-dependent DNA ligase LigA [Alphaproteobacteria bacterium]|nr:NAD-dependent DNA ligase LigA [Alphaproteobacteria bacterium]
MDIKILKALEIKKKEIEYHNNKYHSDDNPEITDFKFDQLCKEYDNIISNNPDFYFLERSSIGANPSNQFQKYSHHKPMTSLNNAFSFMDVSEFIEKIYKFLSLKKDYKLDLICEPKIDGLSISLLYLNGSLVNAVTRGDGTIGEIVTENIKTIKDIPINLNKPFPKFIEIRGEIFMKKNNFDSLNKIQIENGKKIFANTRNASAGSIRQKNTNITKQRNLNFFAFTIGESSTDFKFKTQNELLTILDKMGFCVNNENRKVNNLSQIKDFYNRILSIRNNLDYEIDGLVYKVNDKKLQGRLGNLARAPRWAIAHKLPPEIVETIILNIETQVGRTGALTPVGKLKPIKVGGVTVSNVSLHNEDEIYRKDIRIGDTVKIQRAGDVIPQVIEVVKENRLNTSIVYDPPQYCPSCKSFTVKPINEAVRRCISGVNCPAQAIEKLKHFVSKNAFNIEGFGDKLIENLYIDKLVNDFGDIFEIYKYKDKLESKEGLGKISVNKLLNSIDSKKKISLDKLIYALGIRQIGETNAKLIALNYNSYHNFFISIKKATNKQSDAYQELVAIDQIGENIANDLVLYLNNRENLDTLNKLVKHINITDIYAQSNNSEFTGKVIVLTGTLSTMSRDEAKQTLQSLGAKVSNSLSKKTDYLILGDQPGSKAKKAEELNVKTINEDEWITIVKGLNN